jgi:GT2 family glycosyltransferase
MSGNQDILDLVSICVLSYGTDRRAERLIGSLVSAGVSPDQILEIHNPAKAAPVVDGNHMHRRIVLDENLGYAGGMNVALREPSVAVRRFILLLTHDVVIAPDAVRLLAMALAHDATLACVGPVLSDAATGDSAGKKRGRAWTYYPDNAQMLGDAVSPQRVDALDGSVLMIRAAVGQAVRFDDLLFMYYEEIDFLERIRSQGLGDVAVVPLAHAVASSSGPTSRPLAHAYLMSRNGPEVALRYGGAGACLLHLAHVLRECAISDLSPRRGHWRARERRIAALRRSRARARGIAHFCTRRFGPPPAALQDGDMWDPIRTRRRPTG